jgi:type I restriction enzyme S subunit
MTEIQKAPFGAWPTEPLGVLCEIIIGRTPSRNRPELWGDEHAWLSIADMTRGSRIRTTKEKITTLGVKESGSRLVPRGTVLLSFKLSIGKVAVSDIDIYTNEAIAALPIAKPDVLDRDFLFWALRSIRLEEKVGAVAKGKTLNKSKLERLEIPLPPLDGQRRIAAVLDKADALLCRRQESLQLDEKLLQSLFLDMFVQNPETEHWTTRPIEWMAKEGRNAIRTGPFGSQLLHSEFVDQGIAVLGIDNAVKNRFDWGRPRFISPAKYQDLKRYKVFPGDLIITIMGTLGRCAIVPDDIGDAINTKHLCCITLDHNKCIPEFLHACLLYHPAVLRQMGVRAKGALMPGLNMAIIKDLQFPLPPIELQEQFQRFVSVSNRHRVDSEESQKILEYLFRAIQQRVFRGELDLSRLVLHLPSVSPAALASQTPTGKVITSKAATLSLRAAKDVEAALNQLDKTISEGEQIPWSPDYFKFRILGAHEVPFSFGDLMQRAATVFDDPPYKEIKDMILDLLGRGDGPAILSQSFDLHIDENTKESSGRKEIVFGPAA